MFVEVKGYLVESGSSVIKSSENDAIKHSGVPQFPQLFEPI